jgi:hypothetical protein
MGATKLSFKSKGMANSIRVQGGDRGPNNILGVFSDETTGICVKPSEVRCFVDRGILSLGAMQIFLDDESIKMVHVFLKAEFKARDFHWGF